MTLLDAVVVLTGAALGLAMARATMLQRRPASMVAAVTLVVAGATLVALPGMVAFLVIPAGFVSVAMAWHWQRRPRQARRSFQHFEESARRAICQSEMLGAWPLAIAAALAGAGSAVALVSREMVLSSLGVAVAALPLASVSMPLRSDRVDIGQIAEVTIPTEEVAVVEDRSSGGAVVSALVAGLAAAGRRPVVAVHPPHLFRGLAGWNLGLGLDAEQAAWAGQLARMVGLGEVLAEPAFVLDARQAKLLTVCRAMATRGDPVILEEPASGLAPRQVRDLARVVDSGIGYRRLVVVTADPGGHRSFVSRAQTRR